MHPVIVRIPLPGGRELPLHSYGLMIVLGFLLATFVAARETRRRGLPDFVYDLGLVMLLSGLLGGRAFYYVQNWSQEYQGASFLEFFKIWKGGLVFYGGALGGTVGGLVYLWKKKLPVMEGLDAAAVGIPIAMAFGRLGCFFNGCCFGKTCSPAFPLAVVFPIDSSVHALHWEQGWIESQVAPALPVHPVQLYQAAHDFLLFGLILWHSRLPSAPRGGGLPLLFSLYGVGRFFLEGLRGDAALTWTGFTVSQNISAILFGLFAPVYVTLAWLSGGGSAVAGRTAGAAPRAPAQGGRGSPQTPEDRRLTGA